MLCIAVEVKPRIVKQYNSTNANTVAVEKITVERGWRVEKKCLCCFLADQKIVSL